MAHVGGGRHVGCRTQTGFVREQAPAQALSQCRAHAAADGLLETEGIGDDGADHAGQFADVHHDHQQRQQDVAEGHHRHDDVGHLGDAVDAAVDDQAGADGQDSTGPDAFDAQTVERGAGHGVALEGVEAEGERGDQAHRVDTGQPSVVTQPEQDGARRSAAEGAVFFAALVQLRQRAFDQAGRHADRGDGPHPEHRARAAERDRDRDTGDVATADTPADRHQQRLARGDRIRVGRFVLARQHPEHAHEIADLHEARGHREEQAEHDQKRYQRPAPGEIVDDAEQRIEELDALPLWFIEF